EIVITVNYSTCLIRSDESNTETKIDGNSSRSHSRLVQWKQCDDRDISLCSPCVQTHCGGCSSAATGFSLPS
ncbi:unnamed protein product, partial [Musa acuminata subsp. burmannicoides]